MLHPDKDENQMHICGTVLYLGTVEFDEKFVKIATIRDPTAGPYMYRPIC